MKGMCREPRVRRGDRAKAAAETSRVMGKAAVSAGAQTDSGAEALRQERTRKEAAGARPWAAHRGGHGASPTRGKGGALCGVYAEQRHDSWFACQD